MSTSVEKIAALSNVIVEVKVSAVGGSQEYLGFCTLNQFDPENFQPNGGPIAKKVVNIQAMGETYESAYTNVLDKAVALMGL